MNWRSLTIFLKNILAKDNLPFSPETLWQKQACDRRVADTTTGPLSFLHPLHITNPVNSPLLEIRQHQYLLRCYETVVTFNHSSQTTWHCWLIMPDEALYLFNLFRSSVSLRSWACTDRQQCEFLSGDVVSVYLHLKMCTSLLVYAGGSSPPVDYPTVSPSRVQRHVRSHIKGLSMRAGRGRLSYSVPLQWPIHCLIRLTQTQHMVISLADLVPSL